MLLVPPARRRRKFVAALLPLVAWLALTACEREVLTSPPPSAGVRICEPDSPDCNEPSETLPYPTYTLRYSTPRTKLGIVVHSELPDTAVPWLDTMHVGLVRYSADFTFQPNSRAYGEVVRGILNAYAARQIDVLANLAYFYTTVPTGPAYSRCANHPARACIPSRSYGPEWRAFKDTVGAYIDAALGADPSVRYWSFWNEFNEPRHEFFVGTKSEYQELATMFCDKVHRSGPDRICVGPDWAARIRPFDTSDIDSAYALAVRSGFDVLSLHNYDGVSVPGGLEAMAAYAKIIGPLPVWVTETGRAVSQNDIPITESALDPELQERDVADKALAVQWGGSQIDALFLFDLQTEQNGLLKPHHDYPDPTMLSGPQWQPRPAVWALRKIMPAAGRPWSEYVVPEPGYCSTETGTGPCPFGRLDVEDVFGDRWYCVMTAEVLDQYGYAVPGVKVLGYKHDMQFGVKETNAAGQATFAADCSDPFGNGLYVVGVPPGYSLPNPQAIGGIGASGGGYPAWEYPNNVWQWRRFIAPR